MHICYLTYEYPKPGKTHGGIGTFLQGIAENLRQKNIRVTVLSVSSGIDKDEIVQDGLLTVYYQHFSKWPALKFIDFSRRFNNHIGEIHKQYPIDIIEGNEIMFAFIKKIPGISYVIRMHGGHHFFTEAEKIPTEWEKVWREKRSFSKADALVAVSKYTNIRTAQHIGFDPSKTTVIPNGIDVSQFQPGSKADIVPGRIVFAGTVSEKKGIRQLIMALPEVKKFFPHTHLIVLGNLKAKHRETGGLYIDYLQQFIDPSVKDAIDFVGFVDKPTLQNYIRSAEVCVYPSHMEALPFAWVEVLAMGKTLIAGRPGPGPEVIDHGMNGLLCNPHDPADIAQKILYVFNNPGEAEKMGEKARQTAWEKFDLKKLADTNIEFYQSVIERRKL